MQVKFKLLREGAKMPSRGYGIDVGLDTFTPTEGMLAPGMNKIPLGFSCDVPVGYGGFLYPRTGMTSGAATLDFIVKRSLAAKEEMLVRDVHTNGIPLVAHMPPIDPGYTGEVHALVYNFSNYFIRYPQHTRFGQLVFYPIVYVQPVLELDDKRGGGAMGSTGSVGDFKRG